MDRVWKEINLRFRQLGLNNTLLIVRTSAWVMLFIPISCSIHLIMTTRITIGGVVALFGWLVQGSKYFEVCWIQPTCVVMN
jgi:hypothetical protein